MNRKSQIASSNFIDKLQTFRIKIMGLCTSVGLTLPTYIEENEEVSQQNYKEHISYLNVAFGYFVDYYKKEKSGLQNLLHNNKELEHKSTSLNSKETHFSRSSPNNKKDAVIIIESRQNELEKEKMKYEQNVLLYIGSEKLNNTPLKEYDQNITNLNSENDLLQEELTKFIQDEEDAEEDYQTKYVKKLDGMNKNYNELFRESNKLKSQIERNEIIHERSQKQLQEKREQKETNTNRLLALEQKLTTLKVFFLVSTKLG